MLFVCGLFNRKIRFILQRKICLTRCHYETHYEVLQLPRNCTQKEIKTAFIKLSKQNHQFLENIPFRDKSFWENRDRSNDAANMQKPYYGIKGIKRVSNSWILTCLMLFMLFGVGLQAYLINKSMVFSRKALEDETSRNAEILRRLRQRAQESDGDSAVLERLQRNSDAWRALRGKTTEVKTE
ncbi:Putative molecular chaperone dnaj superfamily [Gryllus bimaculatus]|nr:Putative molecular chaperone dnaj superfamily [Gryllus bimaculatus]